VSELSPVERLALIHRGLAEANLLLESTRDSSIRRQLLHRASELTERVTRWSTITPTRLEIAAAVNEVLALTLDATKARREAPR
jgi:hypothetical protein